MEKTLAALSLTLLSMFSAPAFAADTTLILTKFDVQNGHKKFSIQHLESKNIYVLKMVLAWQNFDAKINSMGYQLTDSESVRFVTPELPAGCTFNDSDIPVFGFMDGLDGGGNLLSIEIQGATCDQFVQSLYRTPLGIEFSEVPSLASPVVVTPAVRLNILDLPEL